MLKSFFLLLFFMQLSLLPFCAFGKQDENIFISQFDTTEKMQEPNTGQDIDEGTKQDPEQEKVAYHCEFTIQNTEEDEVISQELQKKILLLMKKNSLLVFLQNKELDGLLALERRTQNDVKVAIKAMESFGFYSSHVEFKIDESASPYKVYMRLIPGKQYTVGKIEVHLARKERIPAAFLHTEIEKGFIFKRREVHRIPEFPHSLTTIHEGDAAIATDILNAMDILARPLRESGYPVARVTSSSFSINKNEHVMDGTVFFNQGLPATMGEVELAGNTEVSSSYIKRLRPWEIGAIWDERYLLAYRDTLQKTGLFQSVNVRFDRDVFRDFRKKTSKEEKVGISPVEPTSLPILLDVTEADKRSLSGALYYSTDKGPGLRGTWEHRNFFGNGENLRLSMPLSKDEYLFSADFRKPAFIVPKQSLILKSAVGHEETDSYDKDFAEIAGGVELEISSNWWWESLLQVDRVLPDNEYSGYYEPDYYSMQWANTIRYDARNSTIDPTQSFISHLKLSPLYGFDSEDFYSFAIEFDTSLYYPLSEKIILGARIGVGIMPGSGWERIPRTKRFFLGGGGTVRGYSYQELGIHDAHDDPLGGLSYTLVNLEIRIKVAENIEIVPFLDGGMVYESVSPKWGQDIAWGAGVGLRYTTPVGPVRFDIAVPLSKASPTNDTSITDFQIYISIGQAF